MKAFHSLTALLLVPAVVMVGGRDARGEGNESGGKRPVMRERVTTWVYKPPVDENEGKMTLHVQGVYGLIGLSNPVDGGAFKKTLDYTWQKGLGARLTYGMSKRWNLEIDAIYGSTGEARFADVTFDGATGDLVRSARLFRMQGGIMGRFGGSRYRPVVRVGLGAQIPFYDNALEVDGERMPGPDRKFEPNLVRTLGGGLDVRLGDNFIAGVSIAFVSADSALRTIEMGAHLGYCWR